MKLNLLNYIDKRQVAFQFGDGLINFTKPCAEYDAMDYEIGLPDTVAQMKSYISESHNIKIIEKESLLDDELGFADFAAWSNKNDTLVLVDHSLLICIPEDRSHLYGFN